MSQNLHHWVDLIFGYKQRGKPAEEAANVSFTVAKTIVIVLLITLIGVLSFDICWKC